MKLTKVQRQAVELFRGFREREPSRAKKVTVDIPPALMVMGHVEFIGYRTTHGKKAVRYVHEFAPSCRPLLAVGSEPGQVFLIGDRYHVTDRGICDLDANGNEIDDGGSRK